MIRIAIIRFPGTNRHQEAFRTLHSIGVEPVYVLWNDSAEYIASFDGYLLAGGFSYEDRSRAGIIAALDPVMDVLRKEAQKGKAIIGICNGAQMLIESGIVPGNSNGTDMCIAESVREKNGKILGTGFINHWVHLKMTAQPQRSAFNFSYTNEQIHCIIAHGEGRYTTIHPELLEQLESQDQIIFQYCNEAGDVTNEYPTNPNGTLANIAGVINTQGNVLALMPHPEQYPELARELFTSMKAYIEAGNTTKNLLIPKITPLSSQSDEIHTYHGDLMIHIKLMITDTEEQTINDTLSQLNISSQVHKYRSLGIEYNTEKNFQEIVSALIYSGEICNLNKERVIVSYQGKYYNFTDGEYTEIPSPFEKESLFVTQRGNFHGRSLLNTIHIDGVQNIVSGKTWSIAGEKEALIKTNILYNIHSQEVFVL